MMRGSLRDSSVVVQGTTHTSSSIASLNYSGLTFADVFESDSGDEDSGNDESDISGEEPVSNGEKQEHPIVGGNGDLKSTDATSNPPSNNLEPTARLTGSEAAEGTNNTPSSTDKAVHKGSDAAAQGNKFILALMDAAQSYSARLRMTSPMLSSVSLKETSSPSTAPQRPVYMHEVESEDESDDSPEDSEGETNEDGFSSDEYDDAELLSNRPKLNAEQAAQLFYRPTDPWAQFANIPIENTTVVATLDEGAMCQAYIKQGILNGRMITYISKTWLLSQKWEGFFSEMALYSDPAYLRPLQGAIVPRIIGLYLVEGAISVAMELPSSDFWVEASDDMSSHLKRKCIAAYDVIHKHGVLHDDVELRHMLINSRGEVTIIDFQQSRALKPAKEVGLKAATEADIRLEKRKVQFKLDFGDSRERENAKAMRVSRRDECKRQIRLKRTRRAASGEDMVHKPDEDSEPEDPDDVLNPVVEPQIWRDGWIGTPWAPRCYIVPGQDRTEVGSLVQEFLMEELDRKEKDELLKLPTSEETKQPANKQHSPIMTPVHILPTRINLKRRRNLTDGISDNGPSPKKRELDSIDAEDVHFRCRQPSLSGPSPTSFNLPQAAGNILPSTILPPSKHLVPEVHVPFEGYTGSDGFIIQNHYHPKELGHMRKTWIQQYNIQRCIEDKLPYPLAEMEGIVPSSFERDELNQDGSKRQKPTRNRGAMRRALMDMENPGKRQRDAATRKEEYFRRRKEPGTGLSDSEESENDGTAESSIKYVDDGIRQGPKILFWHELESEETRFAHLRRSSHYSSPLPSGALHSTGTRSILQRHLNSEEKAKNVALLERYKKRNASNTEDDTDFGRSRTAKRARTGTRGSIEGPALSTSNSGIAFERYSEMPNAFAEGSGISNSSYFVHRLPSVTASGSKVLGAGSSAAGPSFSLHRYSSHPGSSHGGSQSSGRVSIPVSNFSDITSDSDSSSDGNDQGPSSSAWPPRRKRRCRRSDDDSDIESSRSFFPGAITMEEVLRPSRPSTPPTQEEREDMAVVEEAIVLERARDGWQWGKLAVGFPWKWRRH